MMKRAVLVLALMGVICGSVLGVPLPIMRIESSDQPWEKTYTEGEITEIEPGCVYALEDTYSNGVFDASWEMTFSTEPYVISYVSFTNPTASPQIYTVTFTLPVSPAIVPTSLYGGSVAARLQPTRRADMLPPLNQRRYTSV